MRQPASNKWTLLAVVFLSFLLSRCIDEITNPKPKSRQKTTSSTSSGSTNPSLPHDSNQKERPMPSQTTSSNEGGTPEDSRVLNPAFDGDIETFWEVKNATGWLQYEFIQKKEIVTGYAITSARGGRESDPKDFVLKASQDGTSWEELDSRRCVTFSSGPSEKSFLVENKTAYRFYRLDFKADPAQAGLKVAEIEWFKEKETLADSFEDAGCQAESCCETLVEEEAGGYKNLLFIIVDDLNKTLGTYGHPVVKTPHVDKLARMGVRFENAYANYSVCNPSRSSFLTGLRPTTTKVMSNRTSLASVLGSKVTIPALFKKNGFATIGIGKVFHASSDDAAAWDEYVSFESTDLGRDGEGRNMTGGELSWARWLAAKGADEDQADGRNTKKAVELIKAYKDKKKPFFMALGLHKPHDPFIAPASYFDKYPLDKCQPPKVPNNWQRPNKHALNTKAYNAFGNFTSSDKKEFLRAYYACVSFMDAQVGKVVAALEETGQLKDTLILLLGDHGYHLGENNHWNKSSLYDMSSGAPMILANPKLPVRGASSKAMVEFVDIYPTLAELFDLKNVPSNLEGRSFAHLAKDPKLPHRDEVRSVISRGDVIGRSVKNSKWRYNEWNEGREGVELYDEVKDPFEYENLAEDSDYSDVVAEMKKLLREAG